VIKALIFDLGGVIVPFDFRRGYAAMERLCPLPAAEIPGRIRSTGLVPRYETGQISSEAFVEELCRALDLRIGFDEFRELWSVIFLPGSLIPGDFLRALRQRYRLVALSNTNQLHFGQVRESYPEIAHFDDLVLSYQVGCAKPDRRIYEEAIARAGCLASECLFIDDVEAFVEGGRAAGLQAVRFEGLEQLQAEFQARGIA